MASDFAIRFRFARLHQAYQGVSESDLEFARGLDVSPGMVTDWKSRAGPPPTERVLEIAKRCGVDPGWLAFGEASAAPMPEGFTRYMTAQPVAKQGRGIPAVKSTNAGRKRA